METTTRRGLPRAMVDDVFLAPVNINAGGTFYTTTLDTLTKYPDSKLAKLFDGTLTISIDPLSRQFFLDVNGSVFVHVLDFLRYGELLLPDDFTQLPLLTKLAEYFEIQGMIHVLHNLGHREQIESEKGGTTVVTHKKNMNSSMNPLETTSEPVRGQEDTNLNKNSSLDLKSVNTDSKEASKINIGTCELGIVKIGKIEGGKVEFGIVEAAIIKGSNLESEVLSAKVTETQKVIVENVESEVIDTKSTKVEMMETKDLKSNTLEVDKIMAGNVEIKSIEADVNKMDMLETKTLSAQSVEMKEVNAENIKIKTLEAESLILNSLSLDTLTGNLLNNVPSKSTINDSKTTKNTSKVFTLMSVTTDEVFVITTDRKLRLHQANNSLHIEWVNLDYSLTSYSGWRIKRLTYCSYNKDIFCEECVLSIIDFLINKNGHTLYSSNHGQTNQVYIFCK